MDGSLIDVAIGLLLLFLVASLIGSLIVETVGGLFHRRSKYLWDSLDRLLGRGSQGKILVDEVYRQPAIKGLVRPTSQSYFNSDGRDGRAPRRGGRLWRAEPRRSGGDAAPSAGALIRRFHGPTQITAPEFVSALLQVAGGDQTATLDQLNRALSNLPVALQTQLRPIVAQAGDRLADVRREVEEWYDRHMAVVSEWYRRQTRWFLFGAGLFLACSLNLDAIHVSRTLWSDADTRAAVVAIAQEVIRDCPQDDANTDDPEEGAVDLSCVRETIAGSVALPIGWPGIDPGVDLGPVGWALRVIGWLIVATAVTFGGPFWFDLLRRALDVRQHRKGSA